ncbi:hypothetical protein [Paenibacillus luteus]|uniref:hypothetical protein n=1 Tax=Paenibacillus luteus TaxID=2545753 RepID=UPI001142CD31|nr:hypothetical protein [Paenibacillus luteus]
MAENRIEVKNIRSEYCTDEHLGIVIDDVPLDILLHRVYPDKQVLGLIPTILNWVHDLEQRSFLLSRYQSSKEIETIPILMCPDDCDLWCTLIIAEVAKQGELIVWRRIGRDQSTGLDLLGGYQAIGSEVEWLESVPQMTFKEAEYYVQMNKIFK